MLDDLASVDWASFRHAYGPATDVPDQLRALASPEAAVRAEALEALELNVIHQGSHWPGCVEVVPFLFELVRTEGLPGRAAIVHYLQYLAVGGREAYLTSPPRRLVFTGAPDEELHRRTHEAVAAHLPSIVPLFRGDDAALKSQLALLVAWFPAIEVADLLEARLGDDDEQVVASAALALGYRGETSPRLLSLALHDPRPLVNAAAAVALGWLGRGAEVIEVIETTLRHPPSCPGFAWGGAINELALPLVLPLGPGTRPATIEALVGRFRDNTWGDDSIARALLDWAFPGGMTQPERLIEDLSALQVDVARKVLAKEEFSSRPSRVFEGHGLPTRVDRIMMFFGQLAPDLLESRIRFEHEGASRWWPVWKCLLVGVRAARGGDQESIDATARQLAREIEPYPLAWLAIWDTILVHLNWEDIGPEELHQMTARALALALGDEGLTPLAHRYLRRFRSSRGIVAPWQLEAFVQACVRGQLAKNRGETLAPHHDPMLVIALRFGPAREPLHGLLRALPTARRERLLLAALARPVVLPELLLYRLGVWHFLDLHPSPAVLSAACALLDEVPIRVVEEPPLLDALLQAEPGFLEAIAAGEPSLPRGELSLSRGVAGRAILRRRGGEMTTDEVRREIRQRFWEGVKLRSVNEQQDPLNPCVLCGELYRALGLIDLGPQARGAIEAPNEEGAGGVRLFTELRRGFLDDSIFARRDDRPLPDPAVVALVREVVASGAAGTPTAEDLECCEIGALHLLAARIRQRVAAA